MLLFCLYKQRVHSGVVGVQCGKGMVSLRFRMDSADLDIDFIDLQIIRIINIGVVLSNYRLCGLIWIKSEFCNSKLDILRFW